jgi:hypothetical protein
MSARERLPRPDDIVIKRGAPSDNATIFCEQRGSGNSYGESRFFICIMENIV